MFPITEQKIFDVFLVINIHHLDGRSKMGVRLRKFITSNWTIAFGLKPCSMEKAFPGKTEKEECDKHTEAVEQSGNSDGASSDDKLDARWATALHKGIFSVPI